MEYEVLTILTASVIPRLNYRSSRSASDGHSGGRSSMYSSRQAESTHGKKSTSVEIAKLELLALLHQAMVQSDEAGFDFVSIRISEAIDLLTVESGAPASA